MKRPTLVIGALIVLAFQSCRKEYTCFCDGAGVTVAPYQIGRVQAANEEKADVMCSEMGKGNICWAMPFE